MHSKVLILQNELSSYSVPVYNIIAEHYDLTVAFYLKDKSNIHCNFKKIKLDSYNVGPFTFIKGLTSLTKKYDVITFLPNLRVPSYVVLPFIHRKNKLISWSIGFRASYTNPYIVNRKHVLADRIFKMILSRCDASIFYMEKAKEFWKDSNLDMSKIFIAPNTTEVLPIEINWDIKRNFLFVGTLYRGKGLDILFKSYNKVVKNYGVRNQLHIVGDGEERRILEDYVIQNNLNDKVIFHGAIYDEKKISECFSHSLICISPSQAGLSVPKSMGYGVPFVTSKEAITGGEIYHIAPNVNGIMYDKDEDLEKIMIDVAKNQQKYIEMGRKAKEYYDHHATVFHMAQGAMAAFKFVLE